jgi:hypothetical protein
VANNGHTLSQTSSILSFFGVDALVLWGALCQIKMTRCELKLINELLVKWSFVAFYAEKIICSGIHNLSSDLALCSHRIDADHRTFRVENFEQLGDRGNLVTFLFNKALGKDQTFFAGPRADDMEVSIFSIATSS